MNSQHPIPVILIHGFWDKSTIFNRMAKRLKKSGLDVYHTLDLTPNNGNVHIASLARQLETYINQRVGKGTQVYLVGFSMGGLVARYFLQRIGGLDRALGLITIATPHFGTYAAYAFHRTGLLEMRPHSKFLQDLNSDVSQLAQIPVTSIWARFDTTIVPNNSSRLPIGKEFILPFGIHPLLPMSSEVIRLVEDIISKNR